MVVLAAVVEAVVVVTVENNGTDDVPKDKEVGFDVAAPENVGAGDDDETALSNPMIGWEAEGGEKEKLEELDEEDEPKELVVTAAAGEDENRGKPLLAPNGDEDVPNLSDN